MSLAQNLSRNRFIAAGLVAILWACAVPLPARAITLGGGVPPVVLPADSAALALQEAFIDVAAKVSPAVVNIGAEWTEDVPGYNMNNFLNFWFNGPNNFSQQPHQVYKQKQRALGSGFLITSDGYILTNAHVVGKADKVTVTLQDGTTYPAKIVGKYDNVDIAVIKITDSHRVFPSVVFGDSNNIRVGQWAIAIGNPFGLDHTVTTGVISAKGRSVEINEDGDAGIQNYIQTDASINPGNSGGPLCNIQGEVIGVNSAIYSQSGGSVGIGFAIPSNIARKTAEDLVNNNGKIIRAGLGAVVQSLSSAMAKSFGLSSDQGALISDINPGSAAEKAGLKPGDVVLALNGSPITDSGDLVSKLYTYSPGNVVVLTIQRDGIKMKIRVILQSLSESFLDQNQGNTQDNANGSSAQGQSESLGLAYQDQTEDIRSQLPNGAPQGPVVTQVDPQSPAAAAGLKQGDIILKLDNRHIVSSDQLTELFKKSDLKDGVRLFVWRDGETLYTFIQTDGD